MYNFSYTVFIQGVKEKGYLLAFSGFGAVAVLGVTPCRALGWKKEKYNEEQKDNVKKRKRERKRDKKKYKRQRYRERDREIGRNIRDRDIEREIFEAEI